MHDFFLPPRFTITTEDHGERTGWQLAAPTIGLLIIDGITLAEVTPICDYLENLGTPVIVIVPTGGSMLPISGQYYPAAGGHNLRRALGQVTPEDFDVLLLPDGITGEQLVRYPQLLQLIRGLPGQGAAVPIPVFTVSTLQLLLDLGVKLAGLMRSPAELCSRSNSRTA